MSRRIKVRICTEGRYFLFVLLFIVGSAVFRSVNLLYILAGMMIAPLLFNWRMVIANLQRLTIRREVADQAVCGEPFRVHYRISNARRFLSAWAIAIEDTWTSVDVPVDDVITTTFDTRDTSVKPRTLVPIVPAVGEASGSFMLTASRRGKFVFETITLATRFPFGLTRARTDTRQVQQVLILPALGRLTRSWTHQIESEASGFQKTVRRHGNSEGNYYGLREWRSGDSRRWVHWRTSARTQGLAVKQFEQTQSSDIALLLDLWLPEKPTPKDYAHIELAVSFAATVIHDLRSNSGRDVTIIIRGMESHAWSGVMNERMETDILTVLSTIRGSNASPPSGNDLENGLVTADCRAFVISTRKSNSRSSRSADDDWKPDSQASDTETYIAQHGNWIDVGSEQIEHYYVLPETLRRAPDSTLGDTA